MPELGVIEAPEPSKKIDDGYKTELLSLELERVKAEVESLKNDTSARKQYASKILWLAGAWLGAVFFLLLAQGFRWYGFNLADSVLIALVGGATAGVIGLMASVLAYIFRAGRVSDAPKKKPG